MNFVNLLHLKCYPWKENLTLASKNNISSVNGVCYVTLQIEKHNYNKKPIFVLGSLCADIIIGHDILGCHSALELNFGGPKEPLKIYNVLAASVPEVSLFTNLTRNGQIERLNGTLWRTIKLYLRSRDLDTVHWEEVLPSALHSIRSLLCTSTNATPHESFFNHPRRTANGGSLPTWLPEPGPILMENNNKRSKYDADVEEVELLEANPSHSYIRLADGRETTVSNRQLAPLLRNHHMHDSSDQFSGIEVDKEVNAESPSASNEDSPAAETSQLLTENSSAETSKLPMLRHST
ncbi:hypothetical protein K1T71_002583 [Dendrolimus kikuchii]|uniref:Uncharacterized protein n=1 Tax=Dendrolimus kikuchii TaxID=765133 RepID=A0ACC1DE22_9NEOP|nr:hypothetical protein K1T71_002583 [Dendrolimus kikuchii]